MRNRLVATASAFLLIVLIRPVPPVNSQGISSLDGQQKIGKGVLEAVQAGTGGANVVIALAQPVAAGAAKPDLQDLRAEIARMQQDLLSGLKAADYRPRHTYRAVPALAGRVLTERGLARLAAHPFVAKIDLDVGGTGGLATTVPLIGADLRHALGNTGSGVVVAVIDSGLDRDHDNLQDNLIHEECFLDNNGAIDGSGLCPNGSDRQSGPGAAEDDAGHGTHVTGIITSNGTLGSVGVAPDAGIVALKVTAGPSFGGVFFFFSEVVAALDFIINNPQHGIQVVNMSIGTFALFAGDCDNSTAFNMAGAAAVNTLRANGVIAFASAGNNGSGTQMTSPACLSNVISVGATDNADNVAAFSNSNGSTDVFAPGVGVLSSGLANTTSLASGTSMASPHAAGCAALLIESGEALTPDEIETRLETSGVRVTDPTNNLTFPRIDCSPGTPTVLLKEIIGGPDRPAGTPTALTFETLITSCGPGDSLEFFLNGASLGNQVADPAMTCACTPPLQVFTVNDATLIASLWNAGGVNGFRVVKSGGNSAIAWSRVRFAQTPSCVFDFNGGDCSDLNLCSAGFTFGSVDTTAFVPSSDGKIDLAVEVGQFESTTYDFKIIFSSADGGPVLVTDTVLAEWSAQLLDDDTGRATAGPAGHGPASESATKIEWEPGSGAGLIIVRAQTRGPNANGQFTPRSCGSLILNTGAQAFQLDAATGEPKEDEFGNRLPPIAESNPLCLAAIEDVNGDGGIVRDGSGDEDGDGLTDFAEACSFGTNPCRTDTDGDGFKDDDEIELGSDPLSASSFPAHVTLNNATTPRGNVFLSPEGALGKQLIEQGGSLTSLVAWVGKGGAPGSELGCDTTPGDLVLTGLAVPYGETVKGKIALIKRGSCPFAEKVSLAQSEGAVGVIVYNNAGDGVFTMGLPAGWPVPIQVPAVLIGQGDGETMAVLREADDPRRLSATLTGATP